jgi:hypothetical protein
MNALNIQIPWIYLLQNKDLLSKDNKWLDPDFDQEHEK